MADDLLDEFGGSVAGFFGDLQDLLVRHVHGGVGVGVCSGTDVVNMGTMHGSGPTHMFVMSEKPSTLIPHCRATATSWQVDIPRASPPTVLNIVT